MRNIYIVQMNLAQIWLDIVSIGAGAFLTPMVSITSKALLLKQLYPNMSCSEMECLKEVSNSDGAWSLDEDSIVRTVFSGATFGDLRSYGSSRESFRESSHRKSRGMYSLLYP